MIPHMNDFHHYKLTTNDLLSTADDRTGLTANHAIPVRNIPGNGSGCVWELSQMREEIAQLTTLVKETKTMMRALYKYL